MRIPDRFRLQHRAVTSTPAPLLLDMKKHKLQPLQLAATTVRAMLPRELAHAAGARAVVTDHTYFSPCLITATQACWV
jgi:hypothetical protein